MAKFLVKRDDTKWELKEEKDPEYDFKLVIAFIIALIMMLKK